MVLSLEVNDAHNVNANEKHTGLVELLAVMTRNGWRLVNGRGLCNHFVLIVARQMI